jgi:hypothetical protein
VTKERYQFKAETFYIYYPSEFRVDEQVYVHMARSRQKAMVKEYENLVDEVPRQLRPNVERFVLWEEGRGEHSLESQKMRINEAISEFAKGQIEAKVYSITSEIKKHQTQPPTPKLLCYIFILKNKLACLYSNLDLNDFASDLLADLWNQVMVGFRCIMRLPNAQPLSTPHKLEVPCDVPLAPYILVNVNDVLGEFEVGSSTGYLRIATHAFLNTYLFALGLGHLREAITKLKLFLDYILNNVLVMAIREDWPHERNSAYDVARNLWVVEVGSRGIGEFERARREGRGSRNSSKTNAEIQNIYIGICSMLRASVERVGQVLYHFDSFSIFPSTATKELEFISHHLANVTHPSPTDTATPQHRKPQLSDIDESRFSKGLKLRELISENMVPS